jgi:hypothetical protein
MAKKVDLDENTVNVMKRVLAMPPKRHEEMKVGRIVGTKKRGPKDRAVSAKPRTAKRIARGS